MTTIINIADSQRISYETPMLSVVELESEGVLCASGQFDPYEEDTLDW